jgi:hypothetical protein
MSQLENEQKTKEFENEFKTVLIEKGGFDFLVDVAMKIRAIDGALVQLEERMETVEKQLKVSNFAHNIIKEIDESYR